MLHQADARTLAYINLYGVLGCLQELCKLDQVARALIARDKVSIGFVVKDGPSGTLYFEYGTCSFKEQVTKCDIKLFFSSPEKFNKMMDGTGAPLPLKGFTKLPFLLKRFTQLTERLSGYLKATKQDLKDINFREISTTLMFYVIMTAIAQIGNHDKIGRFSASQMLEGTVKLEVSGGPVAFIHCINHHLYVEKMPQGSAASVATMTFASLEVARDLFEGKINAVASIGTGEVRMKGMISMIDNINHILDRVSVYLA